MRGKSGCRNEDTNENFWGHYRFHPCRNEGVVCVCVIRVRSASYGDERKEKEESGYLNVRRAPVESKIEKLTLPCWPVVYFPFSQEKGEERTY